MMAIGIIGIILLIFGVFFTVAIIVTEGVHPLMAVTILITILGIIIIFGSINNKIVDTTSIRIEPISISYTDVGTFVIFNGETKEYNNVIDVNNINDSTKFYAICDITRRGDTIVTGINYKK